MLCFLKKFSGTKSQSLRTSRNRFFPPVILAVFVLSSEINCGSSLIAGTQIVSVPFLKLLMFAVVHVNVCSKYIS